MSFDISKRTCTCGSAAVRGAYLLQATFGPGSWLIGALACMRVCWLRPSLTCLASRCTCIQVKILPISAACLAAVRAASAASAATLTLLVRPVLQLCAW
jgi:hypothetical protein